MNVFDKSFSWLQNEIGQITEQDILEAKLGVFQAVDAPVPPCSKGMREFLLGIDPDVLQRHRAEIMIVNRDGLKKVAEKFLAKDTPVSTSKVILGPKSKNLNMSGRTSELWTTVDNE